jgi:hypothetical protein
MIDLNAQVTLTTLLILAHLMALGLLLHRFIPNLILARASMVLGVTLVMFFIEHFVGFGALGFAWPVTSAASVYVIWRVRRRLLSDRATWQGEIVFLFGFAWAFLWRYGFPNISPSSERLTNLYFIANYLPGTRLPPVDSWYPPLSFDFYYGLQHYGAALLARWFDLSPALGYHFGFCIVVGLGLSLVWAFASTVLQSVALRALIVATVAIGGTGGTVFAQLTVETPPDTPAYIETNDRLWGGARFAGDFDQRANTTLGRWLFPKADNGIEPRSLPSENFGYQIGLGDYHPPLGGFFLLLLAIALMGVIETSTGRTSLIYQALLGLTVAAQLATNAWVFPLQGLLVLCWMLWRLEQRRAISWLAVVGGGFGGLMLLYPYLQGLSTGLGVISPALTRASDFTPVGSFVATFWPVLLLLGFGLAQARARSLSTVFVVALSLMLFFSEVFFIDDPSAGRFERTNTTMKWWGYLITAAFAGLAPLVLASGKFATRAVVVAALLLVNVHLVDQYRYWNAQDSTHRGDLSGEGVYAKDSRVAGMIDYLKSAERGIVLENVTCTAYCDTAAISMFAAKPVLLGWPMHQQTWRGTASGVWLLRDQIVSFYGGSKADALPWLQSSDVRYVLLTPADVRSGSRWSALHDLLQADFQWVEFGREGDSPVGLWVRLAR